MTPTLRRISAGARSAPWSRRAAATILSIALAALVQAEGRPPAPAQAAQAPTLRDRPLRGVVFAPFPERVETGFHYKNPVSGRMPPVLP